MMLMCGVDWLVGKTSNSKLNGFMYIIRENGLVINGGKGKITNVEHLEEKVLSRLLLL